MSTDTWAAVIDHTSDAGFRAWVADVINRITALGGSPAHIIQTADTGQINVATVTRPGVNTEGGYAVFAFNDTQQGAAPIYFRIGFGTEASATVPRMTIIVGTSTNGAGTIGGVVSGAARNISQAVGVVSTAISYTSHLCAREGYFFLGWKLASGSAGRYRIGVMISRTVDAAGAPDAEGCVIYGNGATIANMSYQYLRFIATTAASTVGTTIDYAFVPWAVTSTLVGSDSQAFTHFHPFPKMRPLIGCCTYRQSEVTDFTTFSVALVGVAAHTYLATYQAMAYGEKGTSANYGLAFIYE